MSRECQSHYCVTGLGDSVKNQTDATALRRGASRSLLQIRRVCIRESCAAFFAAASVRLHGARPWHPGELCSFLCGGERETPRRKAVASGKVAAVFVAASVRL